MKKKIVIFYIFVVLSNLYSGAVASQSNIDTKKMAAYKLISISPSHDFQYILNMKTQRTPADNTEIKKTELHVDATSLHITQKNDTESCLRNKKTMVITAGKEQYDVAFCSNPQLKPHQTILALKKINRTEENKKNKYEFL